MAHKSDSKSQSAMEYLMTYGWSILIIGVVVAVLYTLGIFGNTPVGAGTCLVVAGYQCTNPILFTSGQLSASIGQVGQVITVTGTACTQNATEAGATFSAVAGTPTFNSGQTAQLSFQCLPSNVNSPIGAKFNGYLWIEYNVPNGAQNVIQRIGAVRASVSSVATSSGSSGSSFISHTLFSIQNSYSSTGPNFQQMIQFFASSYSANEAYDLGNIRFYASNAPAVPSDELYSWCESGCTSGSSTTTFWVLLPSGIGANGNVIVNMTFLPTNTEYYSNGDSHSGEAPQLSGTYGEYDNGGDVFQSYTNFAACPTGWTCTGVTINNGVTINPDGSITAPSSGGLFYYSQNLVSDALDEWTLLNGDFSSYIGSNNQGLGQQGWTSVSTTYANAYDNFNGGQRAQNHNKNTFAIESLYFELSQNSYGAELNYVNGGLFSLDGDGSSDYFSAQMYTGNKAYLQWLRFRVYPPNGVMPTVTTVS